MPLGFASLTTAPAGASATPTPSIVTSGGVTAPVLGLLATHAVGAVTTKVGISHSVTGLSATARLGQFSVATPNTTTVFVVGFGMTSSLGETQLNADMEVVLTGVEAVAVQGTVEYIAVGTAVVEGVSAVGSVGTAVGAAPSRWVEIEPVSVPGWTNVSVLN